MTFQRAGLLFAAALALQVTVFVWWYDDLLYLRQPVPQIIAGSPEVFARRAGHALLRPRLTRLHLDTIADAAQGFHLPALEVGALERRVKEDPLDRAARLRLADALRRTADFTGAERIYLDLLDPALKAAP